MTIINNETPLALVYQRNSDGVGVATFAQQQSWRRFWEKAWCENDASEPTLSQTISNRNDSGQITGSIVPTVEQLATPDVSLKENSTSIPSYGVDTDRHTMTLRPITTLGQDVAGLSPSVVRAALTFPVQVPEKLMQPERLAMSNPVTPSRVIEMVTRAVADITRQNVNVFVEDGALQVVIRDKDITPAAITRLLPQLKRVAVESRMPLAAVIVNGECVWKDQVEST